MPDHASPGVRLLQLLAEMIPQQLAGNPAWQAQVPEAMALIDVITDPYEQHHIRALINRWLSATQGELAALQAELVLLDAQAPPA